MKIVKYLIKYCLNLRGKGCFYCFFRSGINTGVASVYWWF